MLTIDNNRLSTLKPLTFIKDNYIDFFEVIFKYSIFTTVFVIIFSNFVITFSDNIFFRAFFAWLISLYCLNNYLKILVTRKILYSEDCSQLTFFTRSPLKRLYRSIYFKLHMISIIPIFISIILFIPKFRFIISKLIGLSTSNSLIIFCVVIFLFSLIKLITLNTDIIAHNKIRLGFNVRLTKNNFLKCCMYFLLKTTLIIMVTFIIFSLISIAMKSRIIDAYGILWFFAIMGTNKILCFLVLFILGVIYMHISVFNHALTTYLYIKLMRQSGLEFESSPMLQPNVIQS